MKAAGRRQKAEGRIKKGNIMNHPRHCGNEMCRAPFVPRAGGQSTLCPACWALAQRAFAWGMIAVMGLLALAGLVTKLCR